MSTLRPDKTFSLPASGVEVREGSTSRQWFKIIPAKGTTLILPLRLDAEDAEHDPTLMREYITGMTQQVYLALIRMAQPNANGRRGVLDYEPGAVAELLGKRERKAGKGHRAGGFTNSAYRNIRDCVARLCAMGVERVGSKVVKNGVQSLVLEVEDESSGRTELHHSSLVWESMFGERADYVQVPDAILRLKTDDTAAGIAVARFWRRYVKPVAIDAGAPGVWRGTASDLLNELDVDRSRLAHRSGVRFWTAEVERIRRVMDGAGMGRVSWSDAIPSASTLVVMEPAADVVASYRRPLPPAIPLARRHARAQ